MKVEKEMTTSQKHLVTERKSELPEATTTIKNSDGTQQSHSLLPVCSNSLAERRMLKEQTSLLEGGVVKTAEK